MVKRGKIEKQVEKETKWRNLEDTAMVLKNRGLQMMKTLSISLDNYLWREV